jgi:hypothetical protein
MEAVKNKKSKFHFNLFLIHHFKKVVIGLAILLIFLNYYFIIKPARSRWLLAQKDLPAIEKAISDKSQVVTALKTQTIDLALVQKLRLKTLTELLAKSEEQEDFLLLLSDIIKGLPVPVEKIDLGEPISLADYAKTSGFQMFADLYSSVGDVAIQALPITIEFAEDVNVDYEVMKDILIVVGKRGRIFHLDTLEIRMLSAVSSRPLRESPTNNFKLNLVTFVYDQGN